MSGRKLDVGQRSKLVNEIGYYVKAVYPLWLDQLENSVPVGSASVGCRNVNKPGSKPPGSLAYISLARQVRTEALQWDAALRESFDMRSVHDAFTAIPRNADLACDEWLTQLWNDAARWHRLCAIALGYVLRRAYPCRVCGQDTLYVDCDGSFGRCYFCGFEYGRAHLWQLARNLSR